MTLAPIDGEPATKVWVPRDDMQFRWSVRGANRNPSMFSFMRRLLGQETVKDVAGVFVGQLNAVKLVLCRWLTAEMRKLPNTDQDVPPVLAGQVVNYLTGEDLREFNDSVSERAREIAAALRDDVPEVAENLMQQDRNLREIVVCTVRMRLLLYLHFNPDAARATGFEGRALALLSKYGAEFPDEPVPRGYRTLVNNIVSWAESPDFPGRDE